MAKKNTNSRAVNLGEFYASVGSQFTHKDAAVIGPELVRLAKEGKSSTDDIVASAKPGKSKLHRYFEWDNEMAAHRYRLTQARNMVNHIEVEVSGQRVRAFHSVTIHIERPEDDGGDDSEKKKQRIYVPLSTVAQHRPFSAEVIAEALHKLEVWRARYETYRKIFRKSAPELEAVFKVIEKVQNGKVAA
jgi:hypothetical protein